MNKIKWFSAVVIFAGGSLVATRFASAHAVVSPKQANVGAFQSFSLGVPVEQDTSTIAVRLLIPDGLQYVTPNVKPGWKIDVKKDGTGDSAKVTEISWTGGSIPAGQRDDFVFSAKVPAAASTLQWKVYQTYQSGNVVSWDQSPTTEQPKNDAGMSDFSKVGPYSETVIVNDLAASSATQVATQTTKPQSRSNNWTFIISIVALALSLAALSRSGKIKSS